MGQGTFEEDDEDQEVDGLFVEEEQFEREQRMLEDKEEQAYD